jgi:hypothetical protein
MRDYLIDLIVIIGARDGIEISDSQARCYDNQHECKGTLLLVVDKESII